MADGKAETKAVVKHTAYTYTNDEDLWKDIRTLSQRNIGAAAFSLQPLAKPELSGYNMVISHAMQPVEFVTKSGQRFRFEQDFSGKLRATSWGPKTGTFPLWNSSARKQRTAVSAKAPPPAKKGSGALEMFTR
jgi:hypothetical protein